MSNQHIPFLDRVLAGDVLELREIDDDIEAWHTSDSNQSLPEWLGMEQAEYALYVEQAAFLPYIVQARAFHQDVTSFIQHAANVPAVAARGASAAEVQQLTQWLRATKRL
jgi:hypothetical protein